MEEKVLVISEKYNLKKLFLVFCVLGVIIGLVLATATMGGDIVSAKERFAEASKFYEIDPEFERYEGDYAVTKGRLNRVITTYIIIAVLVCCTFMVIGGIIYFAWSKIELTATNKRVYGKTVFGKRVDLPVDSISAIGAKWPNGIVVATASGRIAFLMIKNRDEIHKCISDLLIHRQEKPVETTTIKQEIPQSNADELKKYKDLLDSGIITQEEFDAKKKQLLGL